MKQIKEVKIMKNFSGENGNSNDSSIYKARIREQDIAANQKLQEIQGAEDEFARQTIINELKQAEFEREKLKLELEQEASGGVDNILSHVELSAAENEDNFTSSIDGLLAKLFKFFNFMDSELGVETDPQIYRMVEEREKKEGWLAAIIKFLRDKFNKLIKAIFSRDLSFQQKIDQEIGKLFERLFGGGLSKEEEVAILERLEALRDLKLKLQMFAVGWVISTLAGFFSVDLVAAVETGTTKEEDRKTKETSSKEKEATKEVHEIIEIKVDAKEKPTVTVPVSLFDFSSGVVRPITLTKSERDLLSASLKNLMRPVHKDDMNKGNSGVKETKVNENKQAKQPAPKPNVAAPKAQGKVPGVRGMEFCSDRGGKFADFVVRRPSANINKRTATSANECGTANSSNKKGSNSANEQELDDLYAELAKETAGWNVQREKSAAGIKHDYPIDHFQAPAETNGKSHAGAENKPQQSPVDNAQPTGECRDVKVNNHVDSIGKAQEEVSSRGSRTM